LRLAVRSKAAARNDKYLALALTVLERVFETGDDTLEAYRPFLVLADFESYFDPQARVSDLWHNQKAWTRRSILNVARMGKFSSDRSIAEYADSI
jgi:starch phosphorylase